MIEKSGTNYAFSRLFIFHFNNIKMLMLCAFSSCVYYYQEREKERDTEKIKREI